MELSFGRNRGRWANNGIEQNAAGGDVPTHSVSAHAKHVSGKRGTAIGRRDSLCIAHDMVTMVTKKLAPVHPGEARDLGRDQGAPCRLSRPEVSGSLTLRKTISPWPSRGTNPSVSASAGSLCVPSIRSSSRCSTFPSQARFEVRGREESLGG